jgi:metal-sulfur cluster biosynthetic enzyme
MTQTTSDELDAVRQALSSVYDPELGLDIVSLGLVYEVRAEDNRVVIDMTLTTPGCPVSESLPDQAAVAAGGALGIGGFARVDLRVVWDPAWTPERLTPDAATRLGFTGR